MFRRRLKVKPSSWCNFSEHNVIEPGKGVVYVKADGSQYMDRTIQRILSVNLDNGETVITLETDTNILIGPINKGEGFIPYPGETYTNEEVM